MFCTLPAAGQTPLVEISVFSSLGEPLRYSTVSITPGETKFTSEEGRFSFAVPAPGRYAIRVKHLGFAALDTAVTVGGASRTAVKLILNPVAIHLGAMQVRDRNACKSARTPGTDLYIALEELIKNAERDRLLRNSYPFVYKLARRYNVMHPSGGDPLVRTDTIPFQSRTADGYRPGDILQQGQRGSRTMREVRLPSLSDLADDLFLRNHCFSYGGTKDVAGSPAYRIDFSPVKGMTNPDFEGSAYLDTATYMIRKVEFIVTRPERISISGLAVTTTFRELFPGLAVFDTVHSVQPMGKFDLVDEQKLVDVKFLRGSPASSPAGGIR